MILLQCLIYSTLYLLMTLHCLQFKQELATVVHNEIRKLVECLNANRLSLNIDKTNFMIFKVLDPKMKKKIAPPFK